MRITTSVVVRELRLRDTNIGLLEVLSQAGPLPDESIHVFERDLLEKHDQRTCVAVGQTFSDGVLQAERICGVLSYFEYRSVSHAGGEVVYVDGPVVLSGSGPDVAAALAEWLKTITGGKTIVTIPEPLGATK
jgi:hypothetical protein